MRYLALSLVLVGCSLDEIPSKDVVAHTRGVPIVNLVIEGPGGDMVPITYTPLEDTVVRLHFGTAFWFAIGALASVAFYWGMIKGKKWLNKSTN